MTLGDKIKKYRTMRNYTQKELGEKSNFSSATADSRIRKYEKNQMAPKSEKRKEIADALGIDISALSDIDIQDNADIMHIFFELEEYFGMDIERKDGKIHLIFDDENIDAQQLLSYLYIWHNQKKSTLAPEVMNSITPLGKSSYNFWKARFPMDLHSYWDSLKDSIKTFYQPIQEKLAPTFHDITKKSEFINLTRKMIQANILMPVSIGGDSLIITFTISQLINKDTPELSAVFSEFLYTLNLFSKYGMPIHTEVITTETGNQISYSLCFPPLMGCADLIRRLQNFEFTKETLDDWSINMFEKELLRDLDLYELDLKNELRTFYS